MYNVSLLLLQLTFTTEIGSIDLNEIEDQESLYHVESISTELFNANITHLSHNPKKHEIISMQVCSNTMNIYNS